MDKWAISYNNPLNSIQKNYPFCIVFCQNLFNLSCDTNCAASTCAGNRDKHVKWILTNNHFFTRAIK